jgi:AcrR family transcriptional regulator
MRNKQGQSIGSKGSGTRQRLLKAADTLLLTQSPMKLTAVAIAKLAKTSPATFYMYFDDVRDVLLALAEDAWRDTDEVMAILDADWSIDALEQHAGRLVEVFSQFWDRHREVLRYRNMEADRGDADFVRLRMEGFYPFIESFASRILACCQPGTGPTRGEARAIASVFQSTMERLAMEDPESVRRSVGIVRLKAAQARVIAQVIAATIREHHPLPTG